MLETAFARGDADAFDAAYAKFQARLQSTAFRVLQDRHAAGDCVHDALLRLWKRANAYSPARGALEAFLTVCVRNEALGRLRSNARAEKVIRMIAKPVDYTMDDDPIERDRIARAIRSLTPLQSVMIERAYFKAMTLSEIARDLHKPLGTVKSHIASALRALRVALREESQGL